MELNHKDKVIMECLMHDCRMPVKAIAKYAHMTHPGVLYRIKKLEENKFIERYDGLINPNKLPEKIKMFLINVPEQYKKSFENYCIKNKSLMSVTNQIHYFNYLIWAPLNNKDEEGLINYFKRRKFDYRRDIVKEFVPVRFSLFDEIQIEVKERKIKDKILKLDKIDIKIIELMNQGSGRDSVLELSRKLKVSADLALYRFKRLTNAGYFTNFLAHPSLKMNNIRYELVEFDAKDTTFKQALEIVSKTKRASFFSHIGEGKFLVTLLVKDIDDLQNSVEIIQKELDRRLLGIEIYLAKSWIVLNRLDLKRIFNVDD